MTQYTPLLVYWSCDDSMQMLLGVYYSLAAAAFGKGQNGIADTDRGKALLLFSVG